MSRVAAWRLHSCTISIAWTNRKESVPMTVTALGELLIDFAPKQADEDGRPMFAASPGGAPANVCTMAAKLGAEAAFVGKVGQDSFGTFLRGVLLENHVSCQGLRVDEKARTSLAFVTLGEGGERDFCFYRSDGADTQLRPEELDEALLCGSKFLHFGSLSLTQEPCRSATVRAVELARSGGAVISYDPNYRLPLWESETQALEMMRLGLRLADIVKVSQEEAQLLTGQENPDRAAAALRKLGPRVIFITGGASGCFCYTEAARACVPGFRVEAVDTTGAGDTYQGTMLYQLRDLSLEEITAMDVARLTRCATVANAAAAITTTKLGAISAMPNKATLNAFLTAHGEQPLE